MKKNSQNTELVNNGTVNTENNENKLGGKTIMKNLFKENRAKEQEMKEAAAKELARQERLDAIEPINIVDTMDEVVNKIAHCVRDEEGNTLGTNGGKLYQKPITTPDGTLVTIAAESEEALEELEKNIEAGLSGDGKFHKLVYIDGMPCDCVGSTLEELEADIAAAEDYAKAHSKGSVLCDIDIAEQLCDAEYNKNDLEQIKTDYNKYLICYSGKYIMDLSGNTIVDLSDLKSNLEKEDVKSLLIERLNKWEEENKVDGEYDNDDDVWNDEDNDDEYDEE